MLGLTFMDEKGKIMLRYLFLRKKKMPQDSRTA